MIWTIIGYVVDKTSKKPFTKTFYASHNGELALQDAKRLLGDEIEVVAVVAGNHETSVYISI